MPSSTYERVYSTYSSQIGNLHSYEAFHWSSRLFLWQNDQPSHQWLEKLGQQLKTLPKAELTPFLIPYLTNVVSTNTNPVRQKYLEQYPVRGTAALFFGGIFAKTFWHISLHDYLQISLNKNELEKLEATLLGNPKLLFTLSTFALNYLFLYRQYFLQTVVTYPIEEWLTTAHTFYDLNVPFQLQLYIYFITHCIINHSLFYTQLIPESYRRVYQQALEELDRVIEKNFVNIHLDNKLEFLVSCQMCGYSPQTKDRILNETEGSLSPEGFLIDTHNNFPQLQRTSLVSSEHRNVLYVMAHNQWKLLKP